MTASVRPTTRRPSLAPRPLWAGLLFVIIHFFAQIAAAQSDGDVPERAIDLTTALRLARQENPRIAEAEAFARAASGNLLSAYERFLPSVSAGWALQRHEGRTQATGGEFVDADKQFHRAGGLVSARWDFSDGLFSVLAAHQLRSAAERAHEDRSVTVLLHVSRSYWDLVLASQDIRIATEAITVSEDLVEQSRRSIEQGTGAELDLLRARTQLTHDRLALEQALEKASSASAQLAALLNLDQPIRLSPLDTSLLIIELADTTESVLAWLDRVTMVHPELKTREAVRAAHQWDRRRAIWGPLFPDVGASALLSGMGPDWNDLRRSRDYGVSVRWTVGPGGLFDFGRIRTSSSQVAAADARLDETRLALKSRASMWHEAIRLRGRAVAIATMGVVDARRALDVAIRRRETGIGLALEVIDAAEALTRAEREYAQSIVDYNIAQMEVLALFDDFERTGTVAPR